MNIFEIIGMTVVGALALGLVWFLVVLVMDFFAYQKGARNFRDLVYPHLEKSWFFWVRFGIKEWGRSFIKGGGWYVEAADPDSDYGVIEVYYNGKISKRYVG